MAKPGLDLGTCAGILKEKCSHHGWALCIGAGASLPIFPSWENLIVSLLVRQAGKRKGPSLAVRLQKQFSPDAVIEACAHMSGRTQKSFSRLLSKELYGKLIAASSAPEWTLIRKALAADSPGDLQEDEWHQFRDLLLKQFPNLSSHSLARMIVQARHEGYAPSAILSFNAEPLLYALILAEQVFQKAWERGANEEGAKWYKAPERSMDRITQSITYRKPGRIPYFHCHGLLPVPDTRTRWGDGILDKLVFSESEYLQLANSNFSWQSGVFMDVCSFRSVLFIGVSLSDPNMRRWLSWIHSNRKNELRHAGQPRVDSTNHYWINKRPDDANEKAWIESAVAHLGVRLIWLDAWDELGDALQLLLRIRF